MTESSVTTAAALERNRARLLGLAYRMLGGRAEAEDVVQDTWLRWSRQDRSEVDNEDAFLVRIATRLCLDRLKSAQAQREQYVGPWLPEPVVDADVLTPHTAVELAEDLSFALLLALDRLSPLERASFLLHDVFDRSFDEVATTLGRSSAACRQLASRARRRIRQERGSEPPQQSDAGSHERLLAAFAEAAATGDAEELEALLAEDVVLLSDGGGVVAAALNPIRGADKVLRLFTGLRRHDQEAGDVLEVVTTLLNGLPGLMVYRNGELDHTSAIEVDDGLIVRIFVVRNPEKLRGLKRRD